MNRTVERVVLVALALAVAACDVQKSENPLSPSIAGPIAGVSISGPSPNQPANGALLLAQPVTLNFQAAVSNSVRPFWYELDISTTPEFQNIVHHAAQIPVPPEGGPVAYVVKPNLAPDKVYHWRVRAADGANTGPYGEPLSFELITPVVVKAPAPVAPAHGATIGSKTVSMSVKKAVVTGPAKSPIVYRFEVSTNSKFSNIIAVRTITQQGNGGIAASHGGLKSDTKYYWRVNARTTARQGTVTSPWSKALVFKTPASAPPPPPAPGPAPAPIPSPGPLPSPGPGPSPGGGSRNDQIDPTTIRWLHANITNWNVNSTVTGVRFPGGGSQMCIFHTAAGKWPPFRQNGAVGEGNPWVFAFINGFWYGGTFEWLRPGQECKPNITRRNIGPHVKRSPLSNWVPNPGEKVGFAMSTPARDGTRTNNSRSNIVMVTWR